MTFYPGLHHPSDAQHFPRCMISVNTIRNRKSGFAVNDWMMDSGAFTELAKYGKYRDKPEVYAEQVKRWAMNGDLQAAVTQDYMCEAFMLEKTGLTIEAH